MTLISFTVSASRIVKVMAHSDIILLHATYKPAKSNPSEEFEVYIKSRDIPITHFCTVSTTLKQAQLNIELSEGEWVKFHAVGDGYVTVVGKYIKEANKKSIPCDISGKPAVPNKIMVAIQRTTHSTKNGSIFIDHVTGDGAVAKIGREVEVQMMGMAQFTLKPFFSNFFKPSISYILGSGELLEGLDQGILGQKVGGTRIITIPPRVGSGPQGIPELKIPGNADLQFVVKLCAIFDPPRRTPSKRFFKDLIQLKKH